MLRRNEKNAVFAVNVKRRAKKLWNNKTFSSQSKSIWLLLWLNCVRKWEVHSSISKKTSN